MLAVVSAVRDNSHLTAAQDHRYHALGLSSLGALVYQRVFEVHVGETGVARPHTSAADDVRMLQQFLLCLALQCSISLLIGRRQLPSFILEQLQFSELATPTITIESGDGRRGEALTAASDRVQYVPSHIPDLIVQCEEAHVTGDGLSTLRRQPHHSQTGLVDLLSQLIDGNVTRGTDKYLLHVLLGEVVDNGGRCHRLTSARGTLDQIGRGINIVRG